MSKSNLSYPTLYSKERFTKAQIIGLMKQGVVKGKIVNGNN